MTTATTDLSQSTDGLNWSAPTSDVFRDAMRCMASTVSLVTAHDERGRHGMAASAVISVSVDPPSLLVAVNQGASIHSVIRATRRFCVSVLACEQVNLVRAFSSSALRSERFADDAWAADPDGLPYLPAAQCALACAVDAELDYGTHTLFVGQVRRVLSGPKRSPLIWFDGSHASLLQGSLSKP